MFLRKIIAIIAICFYFPLGITGGVGITLCPTMGKPVKQDMACCCETSKILSNDKVDGIFIDKLRCCCDAPVTLNLSAALLLYNENIKHFKQIVSSVSRNLVFSIVDLLNQGNSAYSFFTSPTSLVSHKIYLLDSAFKC